MRWDRRDGDNHDKKTLHDGSGRRSGRREVSNRCAMPPPAAAYFAMTQETARPPSYNAVVRMDGMQVRWRRRRAAVEARLAPGDTGCR